jgi:predicted alpha/beta-fold hydrolase
MPLFRERLELPDGDFLDLDFAYEPPSVTAASGRPIVLVLHGLEGSARSGYALELYRSLRVLGIAGVGMNFRSCGGEMNRLARLYHSGETADLQWTLSLLADRFPDRRRGVIGISLGGNVLLKHLGESEDRARSTIAAAAAISVPFDLSAGADHLRRLGGRLYATHLLRGLRGKLKAKRAMLPVSVDFERALRARSFRDFDDAATAPLHGFAGAADYYGQSSSAAYLGRIRVPTLLIHAEDDPFLPAASIPRSSIEANPDLVAVLPERGGHVGFVAGRSPWNPVFWGEREATRFVATHLLPPPFRGASGPAIGNR